MTMPAALPPPVGSSPLSLAEMTAWGEALGRSLAPPAVVALTGDLGAGKTTLVQAICRGYGVRQPVTSPTFALVHEYAGERSRVYHLDLYRLRDERELVQLGWDELLDAPALILIEWPERAGDTLPPGHLTLSLAHAAEGAEGRTLLVR